MIRGARRVFAAAALLCAASAGASVAAQEPPAGLSEGALDNDAFLPVATEAAGHLARGDLLYVRLRARTTPARPGDFHELFDAWRSALVASRTGDSVPPRPQGEVEFASPWPDPDGSAGGALAPRRTEGVECALLRRVLALAPEERALWTARFEGLAAEAALAAGTDAHALAALERAFPAVLAAARAALVLADLELERGRPLLASTWLARARIHLDAAEGDAQQKAALASALERRSQALAPALAGGQEERETEAWASASSLEPLGVVQLEDLSARSLFQRPLPGLGLQPGAVFLDDETVLIQLPKRVLALGPTGRIPVGNFEPSTLIPGWPVATPTAPREPPGWPLLPASDGVSVAVVEGRAGPQGPNALVVFEVESQAAATQMRLPELRWALRGDQLRLADGTTVELEPGTGAGGEIQPGPVIVEGLVIVQVRERQGEERPGVAAAGEIKSSLLALDLATGRPAWKRLLVQGLDVARSSGRFGLRGGGDPAGISAGQPLALVGERVFAGTHLGAGVLVDAADGRVLWTFKNRRRSGDTRSWTGHAPPVASVPPAVLWAPADADHLYWLVGGPDLRGRGLLLHAPRPQGEAEILVSGDGDDALLLGRAGAKRTVSVWNAGSGARYDSAALGPGEIFSGAALASKRRALFASDRGLYLLDRERELFVLDHVPLAPMLAPGGAIYARGSRILVLGPHLVWLFKAR